MRGNPAFAIEEAGISLGVRALTALAETAPVDAFDEGRGEENANV